MRATTVLLALLALLALAPAASAHGPPDVRAQDFRLLADHSDDFCDDSALNGCDGPHDLVGLDVREGHDPARGDMVYFRLTVNGGSGARTDKLTVQVNGQAKSFEFKTSDDQAFTGTGFDVVTSGPTATPSGSTDGERVTVEGGVKLSALGGLGVKLSGYTVESTKGGTRGDVMPGCYYSPLTQTLVPDNDPGCTDGDAESSTPFARTSGYVLQGPSYYVTVTLPAKATVPADGETVVDVGLANALKSAKWDTRQSAALTVEGADGFTATWVGANGAEPAVEDLAKGGTATAELRLRGDGHAAATGTLTITVTTSLGGRSVHTLPYEITAASPADGGGDGTGGDATGASGGKDSPPAGALLACCLLALAALRRRA